MNGRDTDKLPYGRHRRSAASALVAIAVALVLGALFNAPAMKKTAEGMPFGGVRSFKLALAGPLATVSHWLLLDRPARLTAEALGKPAPGPTAQVVVVTPTAHPSGKPGKANPDKPLPRPYAGHPLHLYIAGDSMAGIPGMALVNLADRTHLIKPLLDYHISTGLARPDFFNWPAELQSQTRSFGPGAAVVMFGANDRQGLQTSSGKVYWFGQPGWTTEYRRRVREAITILQDGGMRRIYWVGQPIMPDPKFNGQIKVINDIFRTEAARHPGVEYVDAWSLFANASGGYAQYLPDAHGNVQQVREQDGEHFTYAGGMRLATAVMALIKKDWLSKKGGSKAAASPRPSGKPSSKATSKP
jgi:hypothetical protein